MAHASPELQLWLRSAGAIVLPDRARGMNTAVSLWIAGGALAPAIDRPS